MNKARQELEKQSQITEALRRRQDDLFSELWEGDEVSEKKTQLQQEYKRNVDEMYAAIDRANDLLYECSGVRRSGSGFRYLSGNNDTALPIKNETLEVRSISSNNLISHNERGRRSVFTQCFIFYLTQCTGPAIQKPYGGTASPFLAKQSGGKLKND